MEVEKVAGIALLAVHAHPDDESLWTGGLLLQHARAGQRTAVVTCTDGELADGSSFAAPGTRTKELAQALDLLGVTESAILPYKDSGPSGSALGSLCGVPLDEVVGLLVERIRALRPAVVVTYDDTGISGHQDHVRVHHAVLAAVEAAADAARFPEAGPVWSVPALRLATAPEAEGAAALDVRPWLDAKWSAVRAHASEFARGAGLTAFEDPELRELFLGTEWFLERPGPGAGPA